MCDSGRSSRTDTEHFASKTTRCAHYTRTHTDGSSFDAHRRAFSWFHAPSLDTLYAVRLQGFMYWKNELLSPLSEGNKILSEGIPKKQVLTFRTRLSSNFVRKRFIDTPLMQCGPSVWFRLNQLCMCWLKNSDIWSNLNMKPFWFTKQFLLIFSLLSGSICCCKCMQFICSPQHCALVLFCLSVMS